MLNSSIPLYQVKLVVTSMVLGKNLKCIDMGGKMKEGRVKCPLLSLPSAMLWLVEIFRDTFELRELKIYCEIPCRLERKMKHSL